ncbi:MAG: ATP-binding protein [Chloroflexota bacterium]|nr:ATP-binding protein [Chloroflexota bacterium]
MEHKAIAADSDLEELRQESLKVLLLFVTLFVYGWIGFLFFTTGGFTEAWWAPLPLVLGLTLSYVWRRDHFHLASLALISGMTLANVYEVWYYGFQIAPYLLTMSVIFAGLLFDPLGIFATAGASVGLIIAIASMRPDGHPPPAQVVGPTIVILLAALASWVSTRNLRLALRWALESRADAWQKAELARDQRASLQRALKALDEASYRIRKMNYELAKARDVAEEMRQLKQQFVANVSHELRTPLALIAGFSEMMYFSPESYDAPLPPEYLGDVREIYRSSQHLLSLVDDILDLSQIAAGRMRLSRQEADLGEVIQEAVDIIRPLIEGKGLALEVKLKEPLPALYIDPTRVRQVLLNLLNNARRFTDQGQVTLRARRRDGQVQVSVSDTGVGITQADQEKIFEEFRQLDGSLARQHDGAGLGLAISREFVEMHGGRIWVESEGVPGRGSTFSFTLPLAQEGRETTPLDHRGVQPLPPDGPVHTVVAISEEEDIFHLLERRLDSLQVVPSDMEQLPALCEELHPLAVLLNIGPTEEAQQLQRLQSHLTGRDVPVILCPLGGQERLASALGVQDYLVKPITRDAFLSALERCEDRVHRVLIVDDDPRVVRLLARMMRSAGRDYEVLRAYSEQDAWAKLEQERPDLMVLELLMPQVDGYAILERMRQEKALRDTPVIVVTAKGYTLEDGQQLGGRLIGIARQRGFSNEEAMSYLRSILDTLRSVELRLGVERSGSQHESSSEVG